MENAITAAKEIFEEAIKTLMSEAVRGLQNYFYRRGVRLEIVILAVPPRQIPLSSTTPSLLSTQHSHSREGEHLVRSTIYIHAEATRDLSRYVIAHELYHIYLEGRQFLEKGRHAWRKIEVTKEIEDECNQFASDYCRSWDNYIRNDRVRTESFYFKPRIFESVISVNLRNMESWPAGFAFDPQHSFTKRPNTGT